jgi:hypothetical protein
MPTFHLAGEKQFVINILNQFSRHTTKLQNKDLDINKL